MLLVAGQLDAKFAGIKRRMFARLSQGLAAAATATTAEAAAGGQSLGMSSAELGAQIQQQQRQAEYGTGAAITHQWAEVPGAGHAVHVEAPLQLLQLVQGFLQQLQNS
jgi:hypothetical protein